MSALEKTFARFRALLDGSAWMLIAPALLALFFIDPPMAKSLLQWGLFFLVVVGLVLVISRICFPQIHLGDYVYMIEHGSLPGEKSAAAIVLGSVLLFVALMVLAFVLWARPLG